MVVQKFTAPDRANGEAAGKETQDYPVMVADRRVEDMSRRVAEQIRVVAEIEAAGNSSAEAAQILQKLEEELKLATEQRATARLESSQPAAEEREAG
jgi:environmental stress-induced protein Ves